MKRPHSARRRLFLLALALTVGSLPGLGCGSVDGATPASEGAPMGDAATFTRDSARASTASVDDATSTSAPVGEDAGSPASDADDGAGVQDARIEDVRIEDVRPDDVAGEAAGETGDADQDAYPDTAATAVLDAGTDTALDSGPVLTLDTGGAAALDAATDSGRAASDASDATDASNASNASDATDAAYVADTANDAAATLDASSAPDATRDADATPPVDATLCSSAWPSPSGAHVDTPPLIAHWEQPADKTAVALTFDDGPDEAGVTLRVLDVLRAEGVRASFFVNSRNKSDVRTSSLAQHTLARIVAEGHVLGNHTADHLDLTSPSVDGERELSLLEADLAAAMPCVPPLSLVRAPYGSPYLSGTAADYDRVTKLVGRHGVHIGWSIESLDWQCAGKDPSCWIPRVLYRIDLGRRGAILLHSTEPQTADGLPQLIAELRARALHFVTAEDLVRAKYGASSAQLTVDYRASH
jgi:peptidoglycan/xylan/chitin deacetylase (PgdA/CDA1 family)